MNKKALITGITGQDGSYLAEFLLEKNYEVHGLIRRSSLPNTKRIEHLLPNKNFNLHYGDLNDSNNLIRIIDEIKPDEVYNLGAQSHVKISFDSAEYTADIDALGTLRLLESIKSLNLISKTKFYQASTSELFGKIQETPQTEKTQFYPRSPYGVAKLYAHWIVKNYCESYGIFACSGILFNHESPRRGETFVTQKIILGLKDIMDNKLECLELGNLDAKRDWGHAKDFVRAMWMMLQQESPRDYVIGTGKQYSVREFIEKSLPYFGMEIEWRGEGLDEIGVEKNTGKTIIRINPEFFRPAEVENLLADPSLAEKELGWKPEISFDELVKDMCESVLNREGNFNV